MNPDAKRTDWMGLGVNALIFGIPAAAFFGSILASITHIKDWAMKHVMPGAGEWQGWQFAAVIELIPIFGLLVMFKLRKVNRVSNVPRWIFFVGLTLSMVFQVAYVGDVWAISKIAVAIGPTLLALGATEILLWLAREALDAKRKEADDREQAAVKRTRQALGLGDIAPPPPLTSPPASPPTPALPTVTPPAVSRDMSPPTSSPVSPDIKYDMAPDISAPPTGHVTPHVTPTRADISQVSAPVTQTLSPPWPWNEMGDTSPDAETAERVVALPDAAPPKPDVSDTEADMSPDTDVPDVTPDEADTEPDVTPTDSDMSPDTDAKKMTDPRWAEAAEMRRNGATIATIATHFDVTPRTVTRWKLPEPNTTTPANGRVPDLTGANR